MCVPIKRIVRQFLYQINAHIKLIEMYAEILIKR